MSEEFSLERYEEIISKAKSLGYWFPQVKNFIDGKIPKRKLLLLRHDVDISVDAALEMAQMEANLGVKTSYYLRLHCPFYNVLEGKTFKKIIQIKEMGHEIGLHYEAFFFEELNLDPIEGIYRDIEMLQTLIGEKILTVSQHNPSISKIYSELWGKYFDAYNPLLIRDMSYFGDSGRCWREGCIFDKIGEIDQIHTLIHPYSWVHWHKDWKKNLIDHAKTAKGKIDRDMEETIKFLDTYLAKRDDLDKKRANHYTDMEIIS